MPDAARALTHVLGLVAIGTALRAQADLGGLLGPAAQWTLLGLGSLLVFGSVPAPRSDQPGQPGPARPGPKTSLALLLGSSWCLLPLDSLGFALAGVGGLGLLAGRASRRWAPAAGIEERSAGLALALAAALGVLRATDALDLVRVPLGFAASSIATVLGIARANASASEDLVIAEGLIGDLGFRVTPTSLGLPVHGLVAAHFALLAWVGAPHAVRSGAAWRPLAYLGSASAIRFALLMALGICLESTRDFDDEHFPLEPLLDWRFGLGLDVAAALVAAAIFLVPRGARRLERAAPSARAESRVRPLLAVAVLTGLLFAADRVLDCAGRTKPGRIAIDEGHSQWEATDLELGRDVYGTESGYNFRALANWLELGYGPVRRLYDPITPELLRDFDVLVIKTPTAAFSEAERAAIDGWVEAGGGLVLIGDHTNVFGTGAILNTLAQPFGFHYDYDCLFDHEQRFEELYRVEPRLARHPIVRAFEEIRFEVGCSIDVDSAEVRPVVVGRGLKSQVIDYRIANFYAKPRDQSHMRCGSFAQLVTRTFGRGRVVALADSTLLSTFSICIPGRRELVEGMIAYANRVDAGDTLRELAGAAGWLAAIAALVLVRARGILLSAATCLLLVGSARAAVAASEAWIYPGHPVTPPGRASREVWFFRSRDVDWAVERFVQDHERTFDLFFQYVSRTGQFPRLIEDFETCLAGDAPLVLIDPDPQLAERAASALLDGVRRGRSLILIESRPNAVVDALAGACGLRVRPARPEERPQRVLTANGAVESRHAHPPGREIEGGSPVLVEERQAEGEPVRRVVLGAVACVGRGHVALLTSGACFANFEYGYSYSALPDRDQRHLCELQYDLLAAAAAPEEEP